MPPTGPTSPRAREQRAGAACGALTEGPPHGRPRQEAIPRDRQPPRPPRRHRQGDRARQLRVRYPAPRDALRARAAQPPRPRPHRAHRSLEGARSPGCEGRDHAGRLPRRRGCDHRPRRDGVEPEVAGRQRAGLRPRALPRARRRRRGRDRPARRRGRAGADRGRVRAAGSRALRARGDGRGRPAHPPAHAHGGDAGALQPRPAQRARHPERGEPPAPGDRRP